MGLLLGCIADSFTGATELASTLVKGGMRAVQVVGVPKGTLELAGANAAVVALKTRVAPVEEAIEQSLAALAWLRKRGAAQIQFKYGSAFESTEEGNIGPVIDALMQALETDFSIVCPAFPQRGFTQYRGHLFVDGKPLAESPFKDHPQTPMRDSNVVRLLDPQTLHKVGLVPQETVARGPDAIAAALAALRRGKCHYAVVDALFEHDLVAIGRAAVGLKLVTGGSGLALGLPANFRRAGELELALSPVPPRIAGRRAVLSGSCSAGALAQIAHAARGWPCFAIDPLAIAAGEEVERQALAWAEGQNTAGPVLIYSSNTPQAVAAVQARLGRQAGTLIERAFGRIADGLVQRGFRQLVVAGGETAGAVAGALGLKSLDIGPEIVPGVPWTATTAREKLALAVKSGNSGGDDFFARAFEMLST
jgi:uncharacterized protein YgbK (DUF1537 family)